MMRFFAALLMLLWLAVPARADAPVDFSNLQTRAAKGDGQAQLDLGEIYLAGSLVPKDPMEADFWATLAINNSRDSKIRRAGIDLQNRAGMLLSHAQKMQVQNRANAWKPLK